MRRRFRRRKLFDKKYIPTERRKTRLMLFIIFWGIIFTWFIKNFVFSLEVVQGVSMYPSFQKGAYHLVNKFIYNFTEPQRKDVVIIKEHIWLKKGELIKRIIGIPGDIIEIKGGDIHLNGQLLYEPYVKGKTFPNVSPFKVKENMYFVLGDNRGISYDSRHFGFIKKNEIRGKLVPDKLFILK